MKKKIGSVLVVGSGISGIRSALDLAEEGYGVTLIDKAPHLGGILSQLDYQFPTDHCGMCKMLPLVERDSSSQFCLRKGLFHENIEIMLSTELVKLEGEPGQFQALLRQKAAMVDAARCTGCGECVRACPVEVPDAFNAGLSKRKAIYLPVPHNIPNSYTVDIESCTLCGECEQACPTEAIDFGKEDRSGFRILVVDDELVVRDSLKEWLADEGFQVEMAESGEKALEKVSQEDLHLMLLDIKMPGMDGVEVLKRAKELRSELPVVMMTAYATVESAVEAMKIGALDYLMKPFDPDSLVPMVVQLYQRIEQAGERQVEIGAVILAAGSESYDPAAGKNTYGYAELPNVLSSLEFERLLSGTGPNQGKLLSPGDGQAVSKVAWLQCIGSREPAAGADFCSSACCMFSIKEALLAKEKSSGRTDTTIFCMDMRTFGKDFQRYCDRAEKDWGVRFCKSRVHTVERSAKSGKLKIVYADLKGERREEDFDLVVLAAGMRPPADARELAAVTGVELNRWGFCQPESFSPSRTNQEGVLVSGSFAGLRDVAESVIQAGSASLCASRLIHSKGGGLAEETTGENIYRDVSRELPRIFAVLCNCGVGDQSDLNTGALVGWLQRQETVSEVYRAEQICTRPGWEETQKAIRTSGANRVLIGACMPYAYAKKIRELGNTIGLRPGLMDVVDIRTPVFSGRAADKSDVRSALQSVLAMGLRKLEGADPRPSGTTRISRKALVVGGGIAGMNAALAIADHGFDVALVEREADLGGNLRCLRRTLDGSSPPDLLQETVAQVEKHPRIALYTQSNVIHSGGHVGRFWTTVQKSDGTGESLEHGVTILASGGKEAGTESYAYGRSESIVTQLELEAKLAEANIDPGGIATVAMIQCVDSREEPRNYCSRVCCASALKNALFFKEQNPATEVYIFYRDLMAYGFRETYYTKARSAGVVFVPYSIDRKPSVTVDARGRPHISAEDPILGRPLEVVADLLVLSTGIVPTGAGELAAKFGVALNRDGFFQEAESKWRPVDFIKEGIFACGIAHSPRSITESIATAEAAAQRALRILSSERLSAGSVVAEVRHAICALCERCVAACPYEARFHDEDRDRIVVNELMCQGCGSCAAICPNSAAVLRGYRDQQMMQVVDAALEGVL
jgi:heterodisulfide reductase subunit A